MVWFVVTQHFCLRGREQQADLSLEDFVVVNSEMKYVKMVMSYQSKNDQGS